MPLPLRGVWGGVKPWVRAHDRTTRQALRGAVHPITDILPGAQEAVETSAQGRRPVRLHPWVGVGITSEGHRGDGAPDCSAAYLRAKAQPGFKGAEEAIPTPVPSSPTTPSRQEDQHRRGGPPATDPPVGQPASCAAPTKVAGSRRRALATAAAGGPRSKRSAPPHHQQMSATEAEMLAKHREQLRIGALSGAAATSMPMGVNAQGQVLFRSEGERRAKREREREQRRQGLRR